MDIFLHGIETEEKDAGNPRFVATIDSGIIFMVGTAPGRNQNLYQTNQIYQVLGYNNLPVGLGSTGTLPEHLELAIRQSGRMSPTIYFNIVEEGNSPAATLTNLLGSASLRTGLYALSRVQPQFNARPKLLVAPGFTSTRPTDGIASVTVAAGGTGYNYLKPPKAVISRKTGTGADTTGVGGHIELVVSETTGEIIAGVVTEPGALWTNAVITIDDSDNGNAGSGAQLTAVLGQTGNPVASALVGLANRYRAVAAVSGPNTNAAAAIQYRLDFDTDRLMIIDPFAKVNLTGAPYSVPADSMLVGLQARVDYEEGFWVSPSNHVLEGVVGTHRPIEHSLSDRSVESQYLNKNHVSTIVRSPTGGYKFWGNRVAKADPLHVFWAVRRSHDVIIESTEIACEPFLDKPFSLQNLKDIANTVNRALRRWQTFGATLGGKVWLDPALNTAESMSNGIIYVSYDGEAPAPMEHIVFVFNRNTGYYTTLLASAAREIARQANASGYTSDILI